jgi:predicted dienelactone hydrolase
MHLTKPLLVAICLLMVSLAQAAGFRLLEIPAGPLGPALQGAVWYPCSQTPHDVKLGPFILSVAQDCPVNGAKLPLIVVSHGWSGSFLSHRDLAETLANAGFVVIAINHGDSALNSRRNGDLSVLVERPSDIRRVIDFMLGAWSGAAHLDARRVGFFGFSRGGYTGLVALGANPVFGSAARLCKGSDNPACLQADRGGQWVLVHDPRIKAAVIADPFSDFFTTQSLKDVKVPVQLWGSQYGGDGVAPESVAAVARALPSLVEFNRVAKSRHFAFLAPCPVELAKRASDICSDAPGFDRSAFHQEMNAKILGFFLKYLM